MSLLGKAELNKALLDSDLENRLIVTPLLDRELQVQQASIDLRLGSDFIEVRRRDESLLDPINDDAAQRSAREERVVVSLGGSLVIHPGQFILGSTFEFVRMPPSLGGQVLSRSSWARQGLVVATAVTVQPGYAGVLTLELVNIGNIPMLLYPGFRIAQLVVWRLAGDSGPRNEVDPRAVPLGPQSYHPGWTSEERQKVLRVGEMLKGGVSPQEQPKTKARA